MTDGIQIDGVDGLFAETGVILVDKETKWTMVIGPDGRPFDPATYHYDETTKEIVIDGTVSGTAKSFMHLTSTIQRAPVVTIEGLEKLVKTTILGAALKAKIVAGTANLHRPRQCTVQVYSRVKSKPILEAIKAKAGGGADDDLAVTPDGEDF